ncbi:MAG: insulinase family protein [Alphaproteobacteria bacterium]|nr:MAG: insulinase family protein [Alphaproteobacteria bacterium]
MTRLTRALVFVGATLLSASAWVADAQAMQIQPVTGASGVEAWLVEDHSVPVVTIRFAFAGGAARDPVGKGGAASMVASLLDEGAGPYDSLAFHRRIDDLAGQLRFSAAQDEFDGSLRSLKQNLFDSADLLRLALAEPRFAPEDIERIRGETLAGLARQAKNPRSLSGRLWMHDAFEKHPYGSSVDGSEESVGAITRDDLAAFAGARFHRSGLLVGIVGDIDKTEAAALIDRVFGDLPKGADETEIAETKPLDDGALVVSRAAVPQSVVTFGQAGPKRDDPAWYAAYVLNEILGGGGFRGRLMKEIREKRGLAYGVSTQLVPYRHAGLIVGNVATENGRVTESIALVREEWRHMREEGPTAVELENAKTYLTGSFPLGLDSTQHIAGVLVQMQQDKLGIDYLDRRASLIGGVTLDEARSVAKKLFDPGALSFAVVGDPADVEPTRSPRPPKF